MPLCVSACVYSFQRTLPDCNLRTVAGLEYMCSSLKLPEINECVRSFNFSATVSSFELFANMVLTNCNSLARSICQNWKSGIWDRVCVLSCQLLLVSLAASFWCTASCSHL